MNDWPIGTRVTYNDEPVDVQIIGTIAEPTTAEVDYVRTAYDGGVGPDYGDLLVEWDDEEGEDLPPRSWEHPSVLQRMPAE